MRTHRIATTLVAVVLASGAPMWAQGRVNIVTTTEDLAAIAREIGGERVDVESIARGYQDPHFVEAKPSFILRLLRADMLIVVGRDLETGWLPALILQSRNRRIQVGAEGYVDASLGARVLDVPQGQITRAMGDVHPLGNPHYWLDPENGKTVARTIADTLIASRPSDRAVFEQRLGDFNVRLDEAQQRWMAMLAPYEGTKVVTYHRSYTNFAERFGLDVVGYVEPRPGIPPSPQHTFDLINEMKAQEVKVVLVEPYFSLNTPNAIARDTGATVLVIPSSVGGVDEVTDYFQLFDYNVKLLLDAFTSVGSR